MNRTDLRYEIGQRGEIDPGVILGYTYPGWSRPTIIGEDAVIRSGSVVYVDTRIGNRFTSGHHVVIRAGCTIGDNTVVLHQSTLEGNLAVGSGVKLMAHVYVSSSTQIGDYVFVGPNTVFLNDKYPMRHQAAVQGACVEQGVAIGGGVTVCPGVTIGQGAFIGAGTLVNRDVPSSTMAYGVPMRVRELPPDLPRENMPELLLGSSDLWGRCSGAPTPDR